MRQRDCGDRILRTLFYFASDEGRKRLPTEGDFLTSEIIAAVVEYLTGEDFDYDNYSYEHFSGFGFGWGEWYRKTNELMSETMDKFGNKLNPALAETLKSSTRYRFVSDHGDVSYENFFRRFPERFRMSSTYFLSVGFVQYVEENIIPSLDSNTVEHLKNIGAIMRKYVDIDLETIKRTYHW